MALLYRQARVASIKIYARRVHPVLRGAPPTSQPGYPPDAGTDTISDPPDRFRLPCPHSISQVPTILLPVHTALMTFLDFFSCPPAPVSAIIRSLKLMEIWGAENDDEKFLLRNLASVCHQQEAHPHSGYRQLSGSLLGVNSILGPARRRAIACS